MAKVDAVETKQQRCPSLFIVPKAEADKHDNSYAGQSHQCDLDGGHTGQHQSVVTPAGPNDKPPAEIIGWQ